MKVLVLGRSGQLARALVERGADRPELRIETAARPEVDFAEPESAATAIRERQPDLVINAAAYTAVDKAEDEPELARRINADAVGEAARAAAEVGAPFVHVSTDYVFDGSASTPIDEDQPVAPLGVYGHTKLKGEEQVRAAHREHVILRTAWVVSPFGRNFVRTMVEAARSRPELTVVGDQRGSPTSALDLADAILVLAGQIGEGRRDLFGRTFHLAGSGEASWAEFAAAIMDEARARGLSHVPVRAIATAEWPTRAARPAYSVLDNRRFAKATGFLMPHWRESLREIVARLS